LLVNSIIDQAGKTAVGYAGPVNGLEVYGNLATDASALGGNSTLGSPTFVDDVQGDYHLKPWSLGVDFAGTVYPAIEDIDLDGNPRNVDLTSTPNAPGLILDAGAYEVQYVCAPDEIFCTGFDH
jgi:hypothetical protein